MATQAQYEYFRYLYEEENKRYAELDSRAQFFVTVETFYLGAIAFKFADVQEFGTQFKVPVVLFLAGGALLVLGLLLTVRASRIRIYESPSDLRAIINEFGKTPSSDEDFFDDRLADFAVATERNSVVNDRVAGILSAAGWCLVVAVAIHFFSFLWAYVQAVFQ